METSLSVYQFAHSPYCLPITRVLEALGVHFAVRNVSNADRTEIIKLTGGAYYQVPVLVHAEKVVYESSADSLDVAHYVDAQFAGGRLFPAEHEGLQRIVVAHLEDDVEGVTFRLVDPPYIAAIDDVVERTLIVRHKERKFGRGCVADWAARHDELTRTARALLEPYELTLRQRPFLFGETPIYADFALYGILGNLTYRDFNSLPEGFFAVADWFTRIQQFRY
jgi:glutathione S-transferase